MANHVHLVSTNNKSYTEYNDLDNNSVSDDAVYLLQKYALPPFWLALFQETDIKTEKVRESFEEYDVCFLLTDKPSALANFKKHSAVLIQRFGEEIAPLTQQFVAHIMQGAGDNILLDVNELSDDVSSDFFEREIRYSHRIISQPSGLSPDIGLVKPDDRFQLGVYLGYLNYAKGQKPENTFAYLGVGVSEVTLWEKQLKEAGKDPLPVAELKNKTSEKIIPENTQSALSVAGIFKKWFKR